MAFYQILLLHHNQTLASSVLNQLEQSIIDQQCKHYTKNRTFSIIQSKQTMSSLIAQHSILDHNSSDLIAEFVNPSLEIRESFKTYDVLLSFSDSFVGFAYDSLIDFASKNYEICKNSKVLIQLFDEKEAMCLLSGADSEMLKIYGFLTRLYCSAFERSHHIHLFAKHHRDGILNGYNDGIHKETLLKKMKAIDIGHAQLSNNCHLASFSSIHLLSHMLSTIIRHQKQPPMAINASASLMNKTRLRLKLAREIKSSLGPAYLSENREVSDLIAHILRTAQKYQTYSRRRITYVSY